MIPPREQAALLEGLPLDGLPHGGRFEAAAAAAGWRGEPGRPAVFQINLGKLCNMTCRHCHVDAGPHRTAENMDGTLVDACLEALKACGAPLVDLTGDAPELHPHFKRLVEACRARGLRVMDRCNLTVLLLPASRGLPDWLAERGVELVCSLPHYRKLNTDAQRGAGTYAKSLEALRLLNAAGYGRGDPRLPLTLVSNPAGAFLAGEQAELERDWKARLREDHGVLFDRLITINNMPISRFLEWLEAAGALKAYLEVLVGAFNPATLGGLMCRDTVSVGWDGAVYDCDFNQMLELPARYPDGRPVRVQGFDPVLFGRRSVALGRHCYGCAAGAGSSCSGALAGT